MNQNTATNADPIETAGIDELQAVQLQRLKWSVAHAYENVEFYRNKCKLAGIQPRDLRELRDLAGFPYTTKQDLRDNYPFAHFAVPMKELVRVHASSGTTGQPTVVAYTQNDIDMWSGVVARSLRAAGVRKGDLVHISFGYGLFTGGLGAHYGAERLGCTVVPMSGGQTEKQVQLILDFQAKVIMATPSYVLNIADELDRQGVAAKDNPLRIGLFGAEPWTEPMRQRIENRLGLKATDLYGLSEIIGPGVAQECADNGPGLTIWEDHFFPEVIDPNTLAPCEDEQVGELVFTSLTKEAVPIIRYRTRDLTRLRPGSGRAMRCMDRITGRSDDMLIVRGVNVFPTQIEELVVGEPGLAPHYFLELTRVGHMDRMEVRVELDEDSACISAPRRADIAASLQGRIKSYVGVSTDVRVMDRGSIERSMGKARRVRDKRAAD